MSWGEAHHAWKGDDATPEAKRARARRRFRLGPCEGCGGKGAELHHKDGDPGNNERANIAIVCRMCHMAADGRLAAMRERWRRLGKAQTERTHCANGHEYDDANTYRHRGHRYCRACNRESHRARQ